MLQNCNKRIEWGFGRAGLSSSDAVSDWSGRISLNNNLLSVHSPLPNSHSAFGKVYLCHYTGFNYYTDPLLK